MDYKTSFAAIMSYALERDLTSYSVAEVINLMKSEYKTEDFNLAVNKQLMSINPFIDHEYGKYASLIDNAVFDAVFDM